MSKWEKHPTLNLWRYQIRGKTRAMITRHGDAALIVVSDMRGREYPASVFGDNLAQNQFTALTMLEATFQH